MALQENNNVDASYWKERNDCLDPVSVKLRHMINFDSNSSEASDDSDIPVSFSSD